MRTLSPVKLKGKDLVGELAHWSRLLVAETLRGLLQSTDHGGGATEENLDVIGWCRHPFLKEPD